ncbi:HEPN domain-containing protein [Maribacter polysiphoniae]|uniref:HEPN domain-containing protein n=1 Tax=Maribacter polysiphoniae TaxID=429344 RepID=A0A316E593_9FLAO|nr:HEPN domain-containing protein [Maribacter polysiphoniae]MBD1259821.1 HEPN domain-containing protein [Maribacter polysiphoniae]PWK25275.1 HEPN domain-containing protein [Maribacter polysiphoniae]
MANNLKIPENFKKSEELLNLMDDILNVIAIDRVFLSSLQEEGDTKYHIITLLVDVNNDPIPNKIVELVTMTGKQHPDFRIRVYTEHQYEIGLDRGTLYFMRHCYCGTIIYASPNGDNGVNLFDYSEKAMDTLVKKGKRYFDIEMRKVDAFARTADGLIKEGDYAIATFNMHQAYELSFRSIEQMCIGRSKITHSIISHINYCKPFFPTLRPFSETLDMEDNELLLLVEHAYNVARYGNEFEITMGQVLRIRSDLKDFIQEAQSIFHRHLSICTEGVEVDEKACEMETPAILTNERGKHETSILDRLKDLKQQHYDTLKPYIPQKGLFQVNLVTEGYLETSFMITNLLKVCIMALETEHLPNRTVPSPEHNVKEVLGYVLDMLPHEEMEFLDKVRGLIESISPKQ